MNDEYERLTNDARYLLLQLSSKYLERISNGESKGQSIEMGSVEDINKGITPEWSYADTEFTMAELVRSGFMEATAGDDTFVWSNITTAAIAWREQKFGNDVKKVLDAISAVRKLL